MKTAIYARVSTVRQQERGFSIPEQIGKCKDHAAAHGYDVAEEHIFTDAYTGETRDRPGLNMLTDAITQDGVTIVLCIDIDRLSRNSLQRKLIEMEWNEYGARVEYVIANYADSEEGELHKDIMSAFAEYENRKRVQRSRDGRRGKAKAGHFLPLGGRLPYGYAFIEGQLVIDEEQAAIVRQMYKWLVIDRLSSYAIAQRLWEAGTPTKGDEIDFVVKRAKRGVWAPTTVRGIITNPMYRGVWHYNKTRVRRVNGKTITTHLPQSEWIAVDVPAIVDAELWEQAQECLKRNKELSKRNAKREYLLRGFVFCRCGRRWAGTAKQGSNIAYYRCPANAERWRHDCNMSGRVRQDVLEEAVWETIKLELLDPDKLQAGIAARRQAAQAETEQTSKQLDMIRRQLADIDRKMAALLDNLLMGDFPQAVIDQKKRELRKQRDALEAQAKRLEQAMQVQTVTPEQELGLLDFATRVWQGLNNFTFEEKRYTLEALAVRVEMLSKDRAKISGKLTPGLFVDIAPRVPDDHAHIIERAGQK